MEPGAAGRPPDLSSRLETLKSKPETGLGRFEAWMPDDEPTTPPTTPASGELVSLVDDDPTARRLMRFWLERAGYRVVEHESGESAIRYEGEPPNVACVDLGLGEVGGFKVIQHLRARDADLPIIVVTAQLEIETAVAAMRAGAYDYVTKPLDRDRLILAVHRARERRDLVANVRRLESALGCGAGAEIPHRHAHERAAPPLLDVLVLGDPHQLIVQLNRQPLAESTGIYDCHESSLTRRES